LAGQLIQRVETMDKQITHHKSVNEKLAHEIAMLERFKFARRSEQLSPDQASLLDDLIDTDIAAIEAKLEAAATDTCRSQSAHRYHRSFLAHLSITNRMLTPACSRPKFHRAGKTLSEVIHDSAHNW